MIEISHAKLATRTSNWRFVKNDSVLFWQFVKCCQRVWRYPGQVSCEKYLKHLSARRIPASPPEGVGKTGIGLKISIEMICLTRGGEKLSPAREFTRSFRMQSRRQLEGGFDGLFWNGLKRGCLWDESKSADIFRNFKRRSCFAGANADNTEIYSLFESLWSWINKT